jgi:hypothetical protein
VGEGVVDGAGELIAGEAVFVSGAKGFAPDEEVAEVEAGGEGLRAGVEVGEGDGVWGGDAEAVVGVREDGGGVGRGCGTATVVVDGLVVVGEGGSFFMGGADGAGEVFAGAGAWVSEAEMEELREGGAVEREAVGLAEIAVPGDAEPKEVFAHGGDELGAGAVGVEIFVAEVEETVGSAGALMGDVEGAGVAEVEESGGGWGEAADVGHKAGSRE